MTCFFCQPTTKPTILSNDFAYGTYDGFPVSPGHLLIVPYRHFESYFDSTDEEKEAIWALVDDAKRFLDENQTPDGYNIGINVGQAAGQSVMHLHIHVIPRFSGDMDDPKGGVRGVIPQKQKY